jgi:hypothetical protein
MCYNHTVSARNNRTAKAARRTHRTNTPVIPPWTGTVTQAAIAETAQYAVTRDGRERYQAVPEQLCLAYAAVAGMMATLATGHQHALQIGGRAVYDTQDRFAWSYGLGPDVKETEFHTWCSPVPPGTSPETLWSAPPWLVIIDLTTGNRSSTTQAAEDCGRSPLPPWWWDTAALMRDRHGITYRAQRTITLQRITAALTPDDDADDFGAWISYLCNLAAIMLGLDMTGWTPLTPGTNIIGHRNTRT